MKIKKNVALIIFLVLAAVAMKYIYDHAVIWPLDIYQSTFSKSEMTWFRMSYGVHGTPLFMTVYILEILFVERMTKNDWIKLKDATDLEMFILGFFAFVIVATLNYYVLYLVRGQLMTFLISLLPFPYCIWWSYREKKNKQRIDNVTKK